MGILDEHLEELYELLNYGRNEVINNTVIINDLIYDLCNNSSTEKGLYFSDKMFNKIKEIKNFNYKNIYLSEKLKISIKYFELVINEIYNTLKKAYDPENIMSKMQEMKKFYPELIINFEEWLENYWSLQRKTNSKNDVIVNIKDEKEYYNAIIYYIAGMTDNFAIEMYNKIIRF